MKKKLPSKVRKPRAVTLASREIKVSKGLSDNSRNPEMKGLVDSHLNPESSNLELLDSEANIGI